jgi:hypothetical protein
MRLGRVMSRKVIGSNRAMVCAVLRDIAHAERPGKLVNNPWNLLPSFKN